MRLYLDQFFNDIVKKLCWIQYLPVNWMRAVYAAWVSGRMDSRWMPGDVVYTESTPSRQDPRRQSERSFPPLPPEIVRLKRASIRYGIDMYVGIDCYAMYAQDHFMRNYALYPVAVDMALGNILEQFNLCRPGRVASPELVRECLAARPRIPEATRVALMLSTMRWDAIHFTDMAGAMVLYQASLIAYLSELRRAISASRTLDIHEKLFSHAVMSTSLKPFETFIIFATLLPLAILMRQDLPRDIGEEASEDMRREAAISSAWREFFNASLLQTDFPDVSMICPADSHLWAVKDKRIVEMFYRFIVEHRQEPSIARLLRDVERVILAALSRPRDYYYKYFLDGGSSLSAMCRLREEWRVEEGVDMSSTLSF